MRSESAEYAAFRGGKEAAEEPEKADENEEGMTRGEELAGRVFG